MLEQITREAHRVPIRLTTPLSLFPKHPPPPPSTPPPECRFIQASSLIHVFIYYFNGCVWAWERRHLVVRTVINSLKSLPLSSPIHFYLYRSNSTREDPFRLHTRSPFAIPLLSSCLFYPFTLFCFPFAFAIKQFLPGFPRFPLWVLIHWRTDAWLFSKLVNVKEKLPSDQSRDLAIISVSG